MTRKILLSLLLLALALLPAAPRAEEDLEGSKDHPAVKRFPGSSIYSDYLEKEFEGSDFPVSGTACEHAEGKFYTAVYQFPPKTSCTQIIRNYDAALQAAKLTLRRGTDVPECVGDLAINGSTISRWVSAVGKGPKGGKSYIFIGCTETAFDTPAGRVTVVETQAMEQKVEIDADYLAGEIEKTGRVAVYGINFATGKADITADSAKVLAEIASLIAKRTDWRLQIEGHTDDGGNAKANLDLSNRRAQAVKEWLVTKHGAAADRLTTQGFGATKPVGDNKTDEGKAQNRRVELVKR